MWQSTWREAVLAGAAPSRPKQLFRRHGTGKTDGREPAEGFVADSIHSSVYFWFQQLELCFWQLFVCFGKL